MTDVSRVAEVLERAKAAIRHVHLARQPAGGAHADDDRARKPARRCRRCRTAAGSEALAALAMEEYRPQ
jgi:predicted cobalt transporter CbtA